MALFHYNKYFLEDIYTHFYGKMTTKTNHQCGLCNYLDVLFKL